MLIKIGEENYVEHKSIVNVEKDCVKYEGDSKTTYRIHTTFVVGRSYHQVIFTHNNYSKRDSKYLDIIERVNAEHLKDRASHGIRVGERFSLEGLHKE